MKIPANNNFTLKKMIKCKYVLHASILIDCDTISNNLDGLGMYVIAVEPYTCLTWS